MNGDELAVFGVASDGSTDQWDGFRTPVGVLLRWFPPEHSSFPDFGFEVYRALVPDVPLLPLNDLNVPFIEGRSSWIYGAVTLTCAGGLHFQPAQHLGWHRLVITPGSPVTVEFANPAWLVQVVTAEGTVDLAVAGFSGGQERVQQRCDFPGQTVVWRTRGLQRVVIEGEGSVTFIGFHLLEDKASWQHLAHLCLPVVDPAYACAPPPGMREQEIAIGRLPGPVANQWPTRFVPQFGDLVDMLRRLVRRLPPPALPASPDPDAPAFLADERAVLALALLDPHVARIVGLAYDDSLAGALDGREYIYKVTGAWRGQPAIYDAADGDVLALAVADGAVTVGAPAHVPGIELTFTQPALDLKAIWLGIPGAAWAIEDPAGTVSTGNFGFGGGITAAVAAKLTVTGAGLPGVLQRLAFAPRITRFGLLPGIVAVEPGPPAGPTTMRATVSRRSLTVPPLAGLNWDTPRAADGTVPDGAPVAYQVGERQLGTDPAAPQPPAPAAIMRTDLVGDGAVIYPPAAEESRLDLYIAGRYTALTPGWWGWWSRGVDLFGRVSAASLWGLAAVVDDAIPPRPVLVDAEYVQATAPSSVTGRGADAIRWLAAHPGADGLVCRWSYGADQADLTDLDCFRVAVRFPVAGVTGPGSYPDFPAGAPAGVVGTTRVLAELGPVRSPVSGPVVAAAADPVLAVDVVKVTPLPPNPLGAPSAVATSLCQVDLTIDSADGIFADGILRVAGVDHPVVSSSPGEQLLLSVEHPINDPIPTGTAQLRAPAGRVVRVEASLPSVGTTGLRAGAGVVTWPAPDGTRKRLTVLARAGDTFLCLAGAELPAPGASLSWYPDWFAHLSGSTVGLAPTESEMARAQVAVRAVRVNGRESVPSGPGAITAVHLTVPDPPVLTSITFDPADTCTVLATAATPFHGRSRFALRWTPTPGRSVTVWRALSDEICRIDLAEHDRDGRPHSFPADRWLANVRADPVRRQRVETELAAIDAARQVTGASLQDAVQAAYDALTIDTQMLLARQDYAAAAFTALTPVPLTGSAFEDEFDGRGHAHWMYRLTSRTRAGLDSRPTEPTPPICAPDVVPPTVPLTLMALADLAGGAVVVHWQTSVDADLHHYDLFATRNPPVAVDLVDVAPTLTVTPNPHRPGATLTARVEVEPGDWWFAIRAVDRSGNRSALSTALPGKALRPRPAAPVWISAVRNAGAVRLRWRHNADARLACLVERRPPADTSLGWLTVSAWLPRGRYEYVDEPRNIDAAYEYRVRVRDQLGQTCAEIPVITLPPSGGAPP